MSIFFNAGDSATALNVEVRGTWSCLSKSTSRTDIIKRKKSEFTWATLPIAYYLQQGLYLM